jgi:hypothetical protein
MDQLMIDIEDNDNCGYFPIQVFETQSEPSSARMITVPNIPQSDEPHDVIGWCSEPSASASYSSGGSPCEVTAVLVGDSGVGQVMMIHGGDYGIRLRPASSKLEWSLNSPTQTGEPYLLLATSIKIKFWG